MKLEKIKMLVFKKILRLWYDFIYVVNIVVFFQIMIITFRIIYLLHCCRRCQNIFSIFTAFFCLFLSFFLHIHSILLFQLLSSFVSLSLSTRRSIYRTNSLKFIPLIIKQHEKIIQIKEYNIPFVIYSITLNYIEINLIL